MDYVKTIAQAEDEKNQIACYGVGKFIRFKYFLRCIAAIKDISLQ